MEILTVCIATGLIGGFFGGLLGIGGATILIPLMTVFLKMTQHQAQGTSLAIMSLSFFSMFVYYKKGYVDLNIALLVGIGFILGGIIGANIASAFPGYVLRKCFAVFLVIMGVKIFFSK
jgi:uncharacterized membrane protein YfcA